MGLAEIFLGRDNPFSQYVARNQNFLGALGGGLAQGQNIQSGLAAGLAQVPQAKALDYQANEQRKADAKLEAQANATQAWVEANYPQYAHLPPADSFKLAMQAEQQKVKGVGASQSQDIQEYEYAKSNGYGGSFADWMQTGRNGAGGPQLGLQLQWAIDPNTKQAIPTQVSTDGKLVRTELDGLIPIGPYDLSAQRSAGTAFGKQTGSAQFDLPAAALTTQQTLDALKSIRAEQKGMDEQFGNVLGVPQQMTPAFPGSEKAKFQVAVDRGTNLAFMQAREMLRGGGQITDFESKKAETAITNMELAMRMGDKQQFLDALATFEQAVEDGFAKLQQQAGGMPGYGGAPAVTGGDVDSILQKYGL